MMELRVGGHDVLRIAAWDSTHAWGEAIPRGWRSAKWLVGAPLWPLLVGELVAHGRLERAVP